MVSLNPMNVSIRTVDTFVGKDTIHCSRKDRTHSLERTPFIVPGKIGHIHWKGHHSLFQERSTLTISSMGEVWIFAGMTVELALLHCTLHCMFCVKSGPFYSPRGNGTQCFHKHEAGFLQRHFTFSNL